MFPTQDHIDAAVSSAEYWFTQKGVYSFPSFRLAQTALESANGTALTGDFNYWGVKANKVQITAGEYKSCATHEVINGQRVAVMAKFASYASLRDGYIEQAKLLVTGSPYAVSRKDTDAKQYAIDVATHYATDPNYAKSIIAYMDQHNLYQYDVPSNSSSSKDSSVKAPLQVPLHLEKKAVATATTGTVVVASSVASTIALYAHGFQSYGIIAAGAVVGLVCLGFTVLRIYDARKTLATVLEARVTPPVAAPVVAPVVVAPVVTAPVTVVPIAVPTVAPAPVLVAPVVPEAIAPVLVPAVAPVVATVVQSAA